MLIGTLLLVLYIVLVTHGIHAVTREGMLLQFLGVYIKGERQMVQDKKNLSAAKKENLDALLFELDEIADGVPDQARLAALLSDYQQAENNAEKVFSPIKYSKNFEAERAKLHWKILLPIAPMLTECLVCMSSFWSIVIFPLYFFQISLFGIPVLVFGLPFCVAGANYLLSKKRDYAEIVEAIKDL